MALTLAELDAGIVAANEIREYARILLDIYLDQRLILQAPA